MNPKFLFPKIKMLNKQTNIESIYSYKIIILLFIYRNIKGCEVRITSILNNIYIHSVSKSTIQPNQSLIIFAKSSSCSKKTVHIHQGSWNPRIDCLNKSSLCLFWCWIDKCLLSKYWEEKCPWSIVLINCTAMAWLFTNI